MRAVGIAIKLVPFRLTNIASSKALMNERQGTTSDRCSEEGIEHLVSQKEQLSTAWYDQLDAGTAQCIAFITICVSAWRREEHKGENVTHLLF